MENKKEICSPSDLYWMWLCSIPGLYWRHQKALLHFFETPENIFHASWAEYQLFHRAGLSWIEQVEKAASSAYLDQQTAYLKKKELRFFSRENADFPAKLKEISDCPNGLFVKGTLPPKEKPLAAIVGARVCSTYGKMMAHALSGVLACQGFGVVSGMAAGIDASAGYGALEEGGSSWAVMGCSADICYPKENIGLYNKLMLHGGILSEFPPRSGPQKYHFPLRNRIISGMCEFVIVAEARARSGSLITADYALEQGRDVWVVPGRCDDPLSCGCNTLISQGAEIIINAKDFQKKLQERYPGREDNRTENSREQCKKPENSVGSKSQRPVGKIHFDDPIMNGVFHVLGSMPKTIGEILREMNTGNIQANEERDISIALTKLVLNGYAEEVGKGSYVLQHSMSNLY